MTLKKNQPHTKFEFVYIMYYFVIGRRQQRQRQIPYNIGGNVCFNWPPCTSAVQETLLKKRILDFFQQVRGEKTSCTQHTRTRTRTL